MKTRVRIAAIAALLLMGSIGICGQSVGTLPELKTSTFARVKYYLSLPHGWTDTKTWPILVTIDGSGHQFLENCRVFTQARAERPFIIVTPCVSSNGNDPADARSVLSIVKEVRKMYHGRHRFYLTGFSAGGHPMWQITFAHPELLAGVAPAAANFRYRHLDSFSKSKQRSRLPIHSFQGGQDPYLKSLTEQWEDAVRLARKHSFTNIDRTIVPGSGHSAFAPQIVEYFSKLLPIR